MSESHAFDDFVMDFCRRCGVSAQELMEQPDTPCLAAGNVEHIRLRQAKRDFARIMKPVFERMGLPHE